MLEAAAAAAIAVAQHRKKPRIEVVLIEKSRRNRRLLATRVDALGATIRTYIDIRPGTLADHADDLLTKYAAAPMVIFMDPYGVKGLDAELVRRALAGPKREVFVQFNPGRPVGPVHEGQGWQHPGFSPAAHGGVSMAAGRSRGRHDRRRLESARKGQGVSVSTMVDDHG